MADDRERHRMVFECQEDVKRAIRVRAALEGISPADVINAALQAYLGNEIAQANKMMQQAEPAPKPTKKRKDNQAD